MNVGWFQNIKWNFQGEIPGKTRCFSSEGFCFEWSISQTRCLAKPPPRVMKRDHSASLSSGPVARNGKEVTEESSRSTSWALPFWGCCPSPRPTLAKQGQPPPHRLPCPTDLADLLQPSPSQQVNRFDSCLGSSPEANQWQVTHLRTHEEKLKKKEKKKKKPYISIYTNIYSFTSPKTPFLVANICVSVVFWICVSSLFKPQLSSLPQFRRAPNVETLRPRP